MNGGNFVFLFCNTMNSFFIPKLLFLHQEHSEQYVSQPPAGHLIS